MQTAPLNEKLLVRDWVGGTAVVALLVLLVLFVGQKRSFDGSPESLFERFLGTDDRGLQKGLLGQIVATEPNSALGHYANGWIANEGSQFDLSLAEYQRALVIDPEFAEAYNGLGVAYLNLGQTDKAISSFERALKLSPGLLHARINLGLAYFDRGQFDDAIRENERVLSANPNIAVVHFNLALAYHNKSEFARAIPHYQEALRIDPKLVQAYFNLALIQQGKGDKSDALKNYRAFLNAVEGGEQYAEQRLDAEARIESLEKNLNPSLFGHPSSRQS